VSSVVAGFTPTLAGLHFPNRFPEGTSALAGIPASIPLPSGGSLSVNDASNGLCGGMAFTAIDYFVAGQAPPVDVTAPGNDSPLFRHLVTRLIDSWDIPEGVLPYLALMNPLVSDGEVWWKFWAHGRAWTMIRNEWPKVRADIDGGALSPLGLIRAKSSNPVDLKHHHQVVAWGYDLLGNDLSLFLYDPNEPDNDNVRMSLSLADPRRPTAVTYTPADPAFPVWCFFRVGYRPVPPP
jgi:hypothetical protein